MSSGTSTEVRPSAGSGRPELVEGRLKPDPTQATATQAADGLEPWHFFVLAASLIGIAVMAVAFFQSRFQSNVSVILFMVLMTTVVLVGLATLRAVRPLVSREEDRTAMVGQRTRAALEREKFLTLRAIKELEFDRAMGKVSEGDWQEMSSRLRARATGLMRQLDAGSGYREQIERDLAKRLGEAASTTAPVPSGNFCTQCGTKNEADAKFCKNCGTKL